CAPAHLQTPDAKDLAGRAASGDFKVYVPAVALREGEDAIRRKCQPRTVNPLREFRRWAVLNGHISQADADASEPLFNAFQRTLLADMAALTARVDAIKTLPGFEVFALNDAMLQKAISLRAISDLKPFDETIFAAVLVKAAEVANPGDSVFFCELDGDLAPYTKHGVDRPAIKAEYDAVGVSVRRDFQVP